ncbi:protein pigeon isoform X1 [Panulirus ornatus]|uniref:protein pigeon isoform X1 n=1 Tax=Panulirus ornatus TaxID=150431 RepID=UPI003A8B83F8
MAAVTAKPILFLEENQYSNFEWIGESQDGSLLCRWEEEVLVRGPLDGSGGDGVPEGATSSLAFATQIAVATPDLHSAQVLYTFDKVVPVVQASVNASRTLLGFVTRRNIGEGNKYAAYVAEIAPQGGVFSLNIDCSRQILLEFLHTEESGKPLEDSWIAKLLVFVHRESIAIYSFPLSLKEGTSWIVEDQPLTESVVRSFVWAQWEPHHNHLYYLHYRPPPEAGLTLGAIGETEEDALRPRPMLTALQFHPSKPHETVLNVPLELSGLEHSPLDLSGDYRDQGLLHSAGDAWLDLRVVTSPSGAVCICHHYIYKSRLAETPADPESCAVYLAYSVTLLHHGCVLHSVVPGVPWGHAHSALPTYSLFGEHYLLVIVPGVCMHMLDIGLDHMPNNHIVTTPPSQLLPNAQLFQICGGKVISGRSITFVDGVNQMTVEVRVTKESLFSLFKSSPILSTRLAILHLASVHDKDHDLSRKLMWSVCEDPYNLDTPALLQEYLVGETYAAVHKHIDSDAGHLISLLPITTAPFTTDTEYSESPAEENVRISYCLLENACIMLLSPRERVVRSLSDTWTKLWEHTSKRHHQRFSLSDVVDKLMVSLDTYKPEALSQGSTPVSPASPLVGGLTITSLGLTLAHLMFDPLPFNEAENTTSSKLEHLLSVNLRELSMYCLKHFPHESPMRVHAVASKYVCTQLQVSRRLCSILCSSQTLIPTEKSEKGFTFIEQLDDAVATRLFTLLERYHSATEAAAFPLPQGYNSFLAYLAHRCLPHFVFMQYVRRGVLQLNVDVLREIIYDLDDTPKNVQKKLEIISSVPLVRSLRALQFWQHPMSLILRSRLHAGSILAGEGPGQPRTPTQSARINAQHLQNKGLTAFPIADRLSPFDTFLDLLTAKANLTELDLGLLYEGTVASCEYIKPEAEDDAVGTGI